MRIKSFQIPKLGSKIQYLLIKNKIYKNKHTWMRKLIILKKVPKAVLDNWQIFNLVWRFANQINKILDIMFCIFLTAVALIQNQLYIN